MVAQPANFPQSWLINRAMGDPAVFCPPLITAEEIHDV
jgi:hypothetical protein